MLRILSCFLKIAGGGFPPPGVDSPQQLRNCRSSLGLLLANAARILGADFSLGSELRDQTLQPLVRAIQPFARH